MGGRLGTTRPGRLPLPGRLSGRLFLLFTLVGSLVFLSQGRVEAIRLPRTPGKRGKDAPFVRPIGFFSVRSRVSPSFASSTGPKNRITRRSELCKAGNGESRIERRGPMWRTRETDVNAERDRA